MANEKVVLRRGLSSTIPSTKVPGTILIETDTGRVWVDDSESDRVQLKDPTKLPLDGKAATAELADKATALDVSAAVGWNTRGIYINSSGKPIATSYSVSKTVPADAKFTDNTYAAGTGINIETSESDEQAHTISVKLSGTASGKVYPVTSDTSGNLVVSVPWQNTTYSAATTSTNGLMSSTDKSKLDGIEEGATKIIIDSAISSTSANPVQNKVIQSELLTISTEVSNKITNSSAGLGAAIKGLSTGSLTTSSVLVQNASSTGTSATKITGTDIVSLVNNNADTTVTANSTNVVTSGAVYTACQEITSSGVLVIDDGSID